MQRKKKRNIKLSIAYKIGNYLLPLSDNRKLKLYLDFAWIFQRLAHEKTVNSKIIIPCSPNDFLRNKIHILDSVLDLGCGSGSVIKRIYDFCDKIVGVDIDNRSLKIVKKIINDRNVELMHMSIFDFLDQNEKKFDIVVLSHILEHIDNPSALIRQIGNITNRLYVEVPDFEATHLNLYRLAVGTDLIYTDNDHVSEFDRDDLQRILTENNFNVIDSDHRFGVLRFYCQKSR